MTGRGRGRGRDRGKVISQPSIQPITTPLPTPSPPESLNREGLTPILHASSNNSQNRPTPHIQINLPHVPPPNFETRPRPTPSPDCDSNPSPNHEIEPTPIPSRSQSNTFTHVGNFSDNPLIESSETPQCIRWGTKDVDGRIWIKPTPGNNFYPEHKTRNVITSIYKKKFEGSWKSWGEVDKDTKEMWFEEFRAIFKWLDDDEANIKKIFNSRGSCSLRNAMSKVRTKEDKGDWIHPDKLKQLEAKWQTDEWKEKSRKAKQNRQTKEGHNVHGGGSISAAEHAKRLKLQLNREPTWFELYERLHRPKGKPNEWFNKEQENIAETYQNRVVETQFENGEGSSSESVNSIFLEVVGGINKKGRIFGMGSHVVGVQESSTLSTPMDVVSSEEVAQMKSTIQALADELQQKNIEQEKMMKKMEEWELKKNIEQEKMKKKMEEWELKFERLLLHNNATSSLTTIQEENNIDNDMSEGESDHEH